MSTVFTVAEQLALLTPKDTAEFEPLKKALLELFTRSSDEFRNKIHKGLRDSKISSRKRAGIRTKLGSELQAFLQEECDYGARQELISKLPLMEKGVTALLLTVKKLDLRSFQSFDLLPSVTLLAGSGLEKALHIYDHMKYGTLLTEWVRRLCMVHIYIEYQRLLCSGSARTPGSNSRAVLARYTNVDTKRVDDILNRSGSYIAISRLPLGLGLLALLGCETRKLFEISMRPAAIPWLHKFCLVNYPSISTAAAKLQPLAVQAVTNYFLPNLSSGEVCEQNNLFDRQARKYRDNLLLRLFTGFSIGLPIQLIHRGLTPSHRWDCSGSRIEVSIMTQFPKLACFKFPGPLESSLDRLHKAGAIELRDNMIHITAPSSLCTEVEPLMDSNELEKAVCALTCHAFPRGPTLENTQDDLKPLGKLLLGQLTHISKRETGLHDAAELVEVLLCARLIEQNASFDARTVELLESIQFNHLHVWHIRNKFRYQNDLSSAELGILFDKTVLKAKSVAPNPRINASLGRLYQNYATYLYRLVSYKDAENILSLWKPLDTRNPSALEAKVQERIQLVLAKLLIGRGEHDEAKRILQTLAEGTEIREAAFIGDLRMQLFELDKERYHLDKIPTTLKLPYNIDTAYALGRADKDFASCSKCGPRCLHLQNRKPETV